MASVVLGHMQHAYAQTDGTYQFPNSREGDMLRRSKLEIEELRRELTYLLEWAENWDSPFLDDPDWISTDGPRIKSLIK